MNFEKNNDANAFYLQTVEIYENEFFSNREKLFLLFDVVKNIFNIISENEKTTFTEFAKFNFIIRKFQFPNELKIKTISFRKFINRIKKKQNYLPFKTCNLLFSNDLRVNFISNKNRNSNRNIK